MQFPRPTYVPITKREYRKRPILSGGGGGYSRFLWLDNSGFVPISALLVLRVEVVVNVVVSDSVDK